jgi:hypothetical protein
MPVGAGYVLMLNAIPRSQQSWACAAFAASAATTHAASIRSARMIAVA